MVPELCREGIPDKLTALIGVEYDHCAPAGNGILNNIHTELHNYGVQQPPEQHLATVAADNCTQIQPG